MHLLYLSSLSIWPVQREGPLTLIGSHKCTIYYSQTGCSFDRNFANFRFNIGIWLTVLSRESCNPREQVAIAFAPFSNILWGAVCQSKFLRWLMMANIHYNRTTTFEKREKIIALWTSGRLKTGTICRRSWIISSNGIQYCEQIPLTRDVFVDLPFRLVCMEE